MLAPIVLFVYNRPWHTFQTLNALSKNYLANESTLYIYADGAKPNATPTQHEALKETRSIIREKQWCKEVHIIESEQNKGLANAIIAGVTEVIKQHKKIIVLEDDMITSPHFLRYMNESLDFYENEEKVANIHAYIYDIQGLPQTFFLKDPGCWGWATWQRGWELFESDGEKLRQEIVAENLVKQFDYEHSYPYFLMLERQIRGENNSWAIRWYASLFLKNKLSLYPHTSLVHNIGNDTSGTNATIHERYFDVFVSSQSIKIQAIPIEASKESYQKIATFWKTTYSYPTTYQNLKNKLKAVLTRFGILQLLKSKISKNRNIEAEDTFWRGNYSSWSNALAHTQGYDDKKSFEQIKKSALQVKNGEAIFERDSKLFYTPDYNWVLINYLKNVTRTSLSIIDFGGALGSTYFQHKWLFKDFQNLSWNVVEQPHFVEFGKSELTNKHLQFFDTIQEAKQKNNANVILLSGVLSYLSEPYQLLEMIKELDFEYIILDRTPFIDGQADILTMQYVNQLNLYQGSYPCWIFGEAKMKNSLLEKHSLLDEQSSFDWVPTEVKGLPKEYKQFKSWFLKRIGAS